MPAILTKTSVSPFLRKHPVFFVLAMLGMFLFVLVLIAAYSSPPQTIGVAPTRRKPSGSGPDPAPQAVPPAAVKAVAAAVIPGMSKRAERIMGAILVVIGVAISLMVLRIVK